MLEFIWGIFIMPLILGIVFALLAFTMEVDPAITLAIATAIAVLNVLITVVL